MISPDHVRVMARYNQWQNTSLFDAAATLPVDALTRDRGAFFGSILKTFNHLLWADCVWLSRFSDVEAPGVGIAGSTGLFDTLETLRAAREDMDARILQWADEIQSETLAADLTWYSGAAGREITRPTWLLVTHFVNHQTHHRGQVHAMLTASGAHPDATDLFLMPEEG